MWTLAQLIAEGEHQFSGYSQAEVALPTTGHANDVPAIDPPQDDLERAPGEALIGAPAAIGIARLGGTAEGIIQIAEAAGIAIKVGIDDVRWQCHTDRGGGRECAIHGGDGKRTADTSSTEQAALADAPSSAYRPDRCNQDRIAVLILASGGELLATTDLNLGRRWSQVEAAQHRCIQGGGRVCAAATTLVASRVIGTDRVGVAGGSTQTAILKTGRRGGSNLTAVAEDTVTSHCDIVARSLPAEIDSRGASGVRQ